MFSESNKNDGRISLFVDFISAENEIKSKKEMRQCHLESKLNKLTI